MSTHYMHCTDWTGVRSQRATHKHNSHFSNIAGKQITYSKWIKNFPPSSKHFNATRHCVEV
uniref:Uncharacterized protein n=1 Tax=Anguilla anguilla TaxID=7936 RepID=A0A0E9QP53_ANGAN